MPDQVGHDRGGGVRLETLHPAGKSKGLGKMPPLYQPLGVRARELRGLNDSANPHDYVAPRS
jgi:hypothetical protein